LVVRSVREALGVVEMAGDDSNDTKGSTVGVLKLGLEIRRPRKHFGGMSFGGSQSCAYESGRCDVVIPGVNGVYM
jgi:hypothetical protein